MQYFKKAIYNDKEYILIDTYTYNSKVIFHFANENDDILCMKLNDKYIVIGNEEKQKKLISFFGIDMNTAYSDLEKKEKFKQRLSNGLKSIFRLNYKLTELDENQRKK